MHRVKDRDQPGARSTEVPAYPNFVERRQSERSSQNLSPRHSGGVFSTMPYPPKPRHIGQTVHTRGSAYATRSMPCNHMQHTDARDEALGQ